MKKKISKLQYITQNTGQLDHQEAARRACEAGCDWIQLRIKYIPSHDALPIIRSVKKICEAYQATFIVNDHATLAHKVGADGVHLGKEDMSPVEARKLLGKNTIIGGTANTFEDIQKLVEAKVDYIGLGPFRFTKTKANLSPVLGVEGYQALIVQCRGQGIQTPIVAIGGIVAEDVEVIMQTGVHGIAVSGLITRHPEPTILVSNLNKVLNH